MSKGWSTRFFTGRLDRFFDEADEALTTYAQQQYEEAAQDAADWWGRAIASSGRGGSHNSQMANVQARVTQPRSGGFFVRVGWLEGAPMAEDGRTSWFVYQDAGYDPFGMIAKGYNAQRVPGLLLQIDARTRLVENLFDANERIVARVNQAARRTRG